MPSSKVLEHVKSHQVAHVSYLSGDRKKLCNTTLNPMIDPLEKRILEPHKSDQHAINSPQG